MDWLHSRTFRVISFVVLLFFSWTFGGLFDIAIAAKNSNGLRVTGHELRTNKKQKPGERFSKAIDDINEIVTDVAIDTNTKKNKLRAKKREIKKQARVLRRQFKATERKLKKAGLPPEILKRHYDFVKQYDSPYNDNSYWCCYFINTWTFCWIFYVNFSIFTS